jgi:hypothetical protein
MAHYSPLGKAAATTLEVENIINAAVAAELECAFGENLATFDGEERVASPGGDDILGEGVSDNEESRTYYFGLSTITIGKIKEMEEKGYFVEDVAHALGAKTMPEPNDNEAVVYKDLFVTELCTPLHPTLADILLHF